jgi:hypothetical protein
MNSLGFGGSYNGNVREEPAKSLRSAADYDSVHLQGLVCRVNCEVGEDPCVVKAVSHQLSCSYSVQTQELTPLVCGQTDQYPRRCRK